MVDEPDEQRLQGEKRKSPTANGSSHLGWTTQEALKVLSDEIEAVVKLYERNLHDER